MQMALEAMNDVAHGAPCYGKPVRDAMDALRAALSAQQEPVAWKTIDTAPKDGTVIALRREQIVHSGCWGNSLYSEGWLAPGSDCVFAFPTVNPPTHWAPLDTPAPTVQPLKDEQIDKLRQENGGALNFVTLREFRVIARAIERARGIGGTHG